ncbi:hypothetical protein niasHS_009739 [Heterodera schachtii]|uniref:Uncharacterized protein n=1 Tax=Heterodera schachtii TaxID=97005 RepID=A0ABD2J3A0_HETSC
MSVFTMLKTLFLVAFMVLFFTGCTNVADGAVGSSGNKRNVKYIDYGLPLIRARKGQNRNKNVRLIKKRPSPRRAT